jgi:DHA2 family multidrug resistance protein
MTKELPTRLNLPDTDEANPRNKFRGRSGERCESHGLMVAAFTFATAAEGFVTGAVGVALPNMAGSFGASPDEISWVVTLYLAAFTVVLPLTAWLSDVLGQRVYVGASMVLYMLASVGCATSHSLSTLLVMRTLQGAAGAPFVARAMVSFSTQLTPGGLSRAMYVFLAAFAFKVVASPVSGYLADNLSWRYLFLLPVPVMGLAGLVPLILSTEVWPRRRHPMPDLLGMALLIAGLGGLFVLLYRGQRDEWFSSGAIRGMAVVAAVAIPLFVWHQHRAGSARSILTLASLRHRGVAAGVFYGFFMGVMLYGGLYVLPQFLRAVGKHDATGAGMLTAIDSLGTVVGMFVCSWGIGVVRTRTWLLLCGALFTASMLVFAFRQTSGTPDEALYLPLVLRGLSIGFLLPPAGMFTFRAVTAANHGHTAEARGLYYMTRQLGGAIGVAVLAAMIDYRETVHSSHLAEHLTAANPAVGRTVAAIGAGVARHGLNPAVSARAGQVVLGRTVVREAVVLSYQDVFFFLAAVGVVVCGLTFLFARMREGVGRKKPAAESHERNEAAWAGSVATAAV